MAIFPPIPHCCGQGSSSSPSSFMLSHSLCFFRFSHFDLEYHSHHRPLQPLPRNLHKQTHKLADELLHFQFFDVKTRIVWIGISRL
nr:hypothetical protein Iba_chr14aCG0530 [Ipomoea batatas]GME13478.1 hypothetical protein Iba_scaffold14529CG0080 [Ipomoea batatas]GME17025.1 hypothetical protein Iba_scaffold18226CG0240 [Ipomoea batatas]GME21419.1 hypothetical protein Iba_scaffold27786CG0010 [Ipomoea batatas]GME21420.1 hypothetical protein Iba_scaffold27787CG0010 [Ipomoea batatas]